MNNVSSVGSSSVDGLGRDIELILERLLQATKLDGIRISERANECDEIRNSVRAIREKVTTSKERR